MLVGIIPVMDKPYTWEVDEYVMSKAPKFEPIGKKLEKKTISFKPYTETEAYKKLKREANYAKRKKILGNALEHEWDVKEFQYVIGQTGLNEDGVKFWTGAYEQRKKNKDRKGIVQEALAENWSEGRFEYTMRKSGLNEAGAKMWTDAYMKKRK